MTMCQTQLGCTAGERGGHVCIHDRSLGCKHPHESFDPVAVKKKARLPKISFEAYPAKAPRPVND